MLQLLPFPTQVENEFGSYGPRDVPYLAELAALYRSHGLDILPFTSDGDAHLDNGTLPGVLATVNFWKNVSRSMAALRSFQKGNGRQFVTSPEFTVEEPVEGMEEGWDVLWIVGGAYV